MATFGLFAGAVILKTANDVVSLRAAFDEAYGDWVTSGEIGPCPKIRRITAHDQATIHRVVATGSLEEQAATVIRVIQATIGGTVLVDVTSNHIRNWLNGTWRAKSALAQQLVEAVDEAHLNGTAVVVA